MSTVITLAAILGGLYIALLLLKRASPASVRGDGSQLVSILSSRRLDAQSSVHVVRIGRRVLAIGSSPAGLTTLGAFDDPTDLEPTPASPAERSGAASQRPLFNGTRPLRRTADQLVRSSHATDVTGVADG